MKYFNLIAMTVLAVLISVISERTSVFAQTGKDADGAVQTVIENRLAKHDLLTGNDIKIDVGDSAITLRGNVATLYQRQQVEHEALSVGENYRMLDSLTVKPVKISNEELKKNIVKRINDNVFYSIFDWVTLDISNGAVNLGGWVNEPWHKGQFERQVQRVPGVIQITNNIKVESPSIYDDDIRNTAAQLIYNDPSFEHYSGATGDPIHIIVNNGEVTLEGDVAYASQRNWAENTITANTEAFKVTNNLRVENR